MKVAVLRGCDGSYTMYTYFGSPRDWLLLVNELRAHAPLDVAHAIPMLTTLMTTRGISAEFWLGFVILSSHAAYATTRLVGRCNQCKQM